VREEEQTVIRIAFRRLTEDDLPLMHRWLNTPHVMRWWNSGGQTMAEVQEKYLPCITGAAPTEPYLILCGGTPIGYIQTYRINHWPDYARHIGVDDDTAGVDLFIGEPEYIGRGLGPAAIRTFLCEVVFGSFDAGACVIGPSVENQGAIRAYTKAGFRFWKHADVPGEPTPEYLMRITAADLAGSEPPADGAGSADGGEPRTQRGAGLDEAVGTGVRYSRETHTR